MGMLKEFREFAVKGSVVDLAVGIIIGGAFGAIVSSLVNDVLMPPIGWATGNVDFSSLTYTLSAEGPDGKPVEIRYGKFINSIITFVIVAFAVFLLVKQINRLKRTGAPPAPNTRNCPYCVTAVDMKATRCPHCTSELSASR